MRRFLPRPGPPRVLAATVAVAVAAGAIGWIVGARVQSPADAAASHRPPAASLVTVPVEQRVLTATVTARGSVGYGSAAPVTLTGSVAAEGDTVAAQLVTKAPTAGRTVREGDVLLEISGRPVLVLKGAVPMYRTVERGSTGDDVRQIRAAMRRLLPARGLSASGPLDDRTLAAVSAWYTKRGYRAAGPTAEQREQLQRLQDAVTTAAGGGQALTDAKAALAEFRKTYGDKVPSGEILFLPALPVRLTEVTAKVGAPASGPVATVADPSPVVSADVATEDADLLKVGMPATLRLDTGETVGGTVTVIGAAAATKPAEDGEDGDGDQTATRAGVAVRVVPREPGRLVKLAGQSLKIDITVGGTDEAVLTVPVAAVFTGSDSQARVSVQSGAEGTREVPVTTGLTVDGYVQVTPRDDDLRAGDRVVVSSS